MASASTLIGLVGGGLLLGVIVIYAVLMYNGLIRLRRNIDKAWSNIEVLLKQRSDELPKLIDAVEQYMDYEQSVLQDVTEARTEAEKAKGPAEEAQADSMLRGALGNLFAVAEDYPELKADEEFQQLQERISSLEDQIADRREFYNDSVNTFNIRINQIPYNVVANAMGYTEKELFKPEEGDLQDVDVGKRFQE